MGKEERRRDMSPCLPCLASASPDSCSFSPPGDLGPCVTQEVENHPLVFFLFFLPGAAVVVQAGMHLLRKVSAALRQQPSFLCPAPEGYPSGEVAAASCLTSVTGNLSDWFTLRSRSKALRPFVEINLNNGRSNFCL